jgi:hypothetical protein
MRCQAVSELGLHTRDCFHIGEIRQVPIVPCFDGFTGLLTHWDPSSAQRLESWTHRGSLVAQALQGQHILRFAPGKHRNEEIDLNGLFLRRQVPVAAHPNSTTALLHEEPIGLRDACQDKVPHVQKADSFREVICVSNNKSEFLTANIRKMVEICQLVRPCHAKGRHTLLRHFLQQLEGEAICSMFHHYEGFLGSGCNNLRNRIKFRAELFRLHQDFQLGAGVELLFRNVAEGAQGSPTQTISLVFQILLIERV